MYNIFTLDFGLNHPVPEPPRMSILQEQNGSVQSQVKVTLRPMASQSECPGV
jgi:hypothetical protein